MWGAGGRCTETIAAAPRPPPPTPHPPPPPPTPPFRFDPLESDPVMQAVRNKPEPSYMPPELREPPLTERRPHERLLRPPVETLVNRRPPSWEEARRQVMEYTRRQQALGLAPEGIERVLGPGAWDHDPAFWGGRGREGTLEHEIDDGHM